VRICLYLCILLSLSLRSVNNNHYIIIMTRTILYFVGVLYAKFADHSDLYFTSPAARHTTISYQSTYRIYKRACDIAGSNSSDFRFGVMLYLNQRTSSSVMLYLYNMGFLYVILIFYQVICKRAQQLKLLA